MGVLSNISKFAEETCGLSFCDNGLYGLDGEESKYIAISANPDDTVNVGIYHEGTMSMVGVVENLQFQDACDEVTKIASELSGRPKLTIVH